MVLNAYNAIFGRLRLEDILLARRINVTPATRNDLPSFLEMERANDTQEFIQVYSLEDHERAFSTPGTTYLRIVDEERLIGFFILAAENGGRSTEFRRIVVREGARGVGQTAIQMMERYCQDQLACNRIWLDVYERNSRAIHIYEKLGYRQFGTDGSGADRLMLYSKSLPN